MPLEEKVKGGGTFNYSNLGYLSGKGINSKALASCRIRKFH
jgi:hypothetical protein